MYSFLHICAPDSVAHQEIEFQFQLLTALQAMMTAVFVVRFSFFALVAISQRTW